MFLLSQRLIGQEMYLKVGDETRNGSTSTDFKDYIQIDAAQFGTSSSVTVGGSMPTVGKPVFGNLVISKVNDKVSIYFLKCLAGGRLIPRVELVLAFFYDQSDKMLISQKIELNDAFVTSVSSAGASRECSRCGFSETVSLAYTQIRVTTNTYDLQGKLSGAPSVFVFDLQSGKESFQN